MSLIGLAASFPDEVSARVRTKLARNLRRQLVGESPRSSVRTREIPRWFRRTISRTNPRRHEPASSTCGTKYVFYGLRDMFSSHRCPYRPVRPLGEPAEAFPPVQYLLAQRHCLRIAEKCSTWNIFSKSLLVASMWRESLGWWSNRRRALLASQAGCPGPRDCEWGRVSCSKKMFHVEQFPISHMDSTT
jgi:hypothetical protein